MHGVFGQEEKIQKARMVFFEKKKNPKNMHVVFGQEEKSKKHVVFLDKRGAVTWGLLGVHCPSRE